MPTALEIAQVTPGAEQSAQLLMGVVAKLPVIETFDAREITSDKFFSIALTSLPTGRFLNLGEGYQNSTTSLALAEYNASRIGGSVEVHADTEEKWNRNNQSSIGAGLAMDYFSIQAMGQNLGYMRHVQKQIFNGVSNDAKGFPGMLALTPYVSGNVLSMTDTAQDSEFSKTVLNVGGSTSMTGSSIYAVKFGPMDCQLVIGGPGGLPGFLALGTPVKTWVKNTDAVDSVVKGDWYNVATCQGFIGLSVGGGNEANASRKFPQYCLRRAANVTAQAGYTCTDAMLLRLVNSMPESPDRLYMSHRSLDQLRASRSPTSTVYVGGVMPGNSSYNVARPVTDFEGIPITATDAITNANAIES